MPLHFDPKTAKIKQKPLSYLISVYDEMEINNCVLTTTGKILLLMTFERFGGS